MIKKEQKEGLTAYSFSTGFNFEIPDFKKGVKNDFIFSNTIWTLVEEILSLQKELEKVKKEFAKTGKGK